MRIAALTGAIGAVVMYFLDPERGRRRRHEARDRALAFARRGWRGSLRRGRRMAGDIYGLRQRSVHLGGEPKDLDDVTLAHKVESEAFRGAAVPKGQINVNVEDGVVILRGEIEQPELGEDLERRVSRVPGVKGVENLLHLPGSPPSHAPSHRFGASS